MLAKRAFLFLICILLSMPLSSSAFNRDFSKQWQVNFDSVLSISDQPIPIVKKIEQENSNKENLKML